MYISSISPGLFSGRSSTGTYAKYSATYLVGWKPHSIIVPYLPLPSGFCCPLASCLQQKIIHLLVWYTKPTLFLATCIYHSKFTSRLWGWRKWKRKKKPARSVFLHSSTCPLPQVSTSSDIERHRLLLELSLQLCLFLESTTLNGQMMITVVRMQFFSSSVPQLNGFLQTQSQLVFFTMTQKHFKLFSSWKWAFYWQLEISSTDISHF